MKERLYPIRNPNQIAQLKNVFDAKLVKNRTAGEKAYSLGEVSGFAGYARERMGNEYEFKLELAPQTQEEIDTRIVTPLKEISKRYGIEQFYPGDGELPSHITLEVAKFEGVNEEEKARLLEELQDNSRFAVLANVLKGLDVSFDTLVTSGRDAYLCQGTFDEFQLGAIHKARRIIAGTMSRTVKMGPEGNPHGLIMPINYQDIVHSTVARIHTAPQDSNVLLAYSKAVESEIGVPLNQDPIEAIIQNVYHGSALKYHVEHNSPQLHTE